MGNRILYNVTVNVDANVERQWLKWMKDKHIPDVMRTGFFLEYRICRIHAHEEGGIGYAIQYTCAGMQDLEEYRQKHAARLQEEHNRKFEGKFAAFRTILEIIHEQKSPIAGVHPN